MSGWGRDVTHDEGWLLSPWGSLYNPRTHYVNARTGSVEFLVNGEVPPNAQTAITYYYDNGNEVSRESYLSHYTLSTPSPLATLSMATSFLAAPTAAGIRSLYVARGIPIGNEPAVDAWLSNWAAAESGSTLAALDAQIALNYPGTVSTLALGDVPGQLQGSLSPAVMRGTSGLSLVPGSLQPLTLGDAGPAFRMPPLVWLVLAYVAYRALK